MPKPKAKRVKAPVIQTAKAPSFEVRFTALQLQIAAFVDVVASSTGGLEGLILQISALIGDVEVMIGELGEIKKSAPVKSLADLGAALKAAQKASTDVTPERAKDMRGALTQQLQLLREYPTRLTRIKSQLEGIGAQAGAELAEEFLKKYAAQIKFEVPFDDANVEVWLSGLIAKALESGKSAQSQFFLRLCTILRLPDIKEFTEETARKVTERASENSSAFQTRVFLLGAILDRVIKDALGGYHGAEKDVLKLAKEMEIVSADYRFPTLNADDTISLFEKLLIERLPQGAADALSKTTNALQGLRDNDEASLTDMELAEIIKQLRQKAMV